MKPTYIIFLEPGDVLYFGGGTLQNKVQLLIKTRVIWVAGLYIHFLLGMSPSDHQDSGKKIVDPNLNFAVFSGILGGAASTFLPSLKLTFFTSENQLVLEDASFPYGDFA